MRFLMLCTKYPLDPNDRYLTNELAGTLVARGDDVQVVVVDWNAPYASPAKSLRSSDGVKVLVLAPRAIRRFGRFVEMASKWTLSSFAALRDLRRAVDMSSFDAVISFAPCVTVAAPLWWTLRRTRVRSILFIHDFFPYHHRAIGLIPSSAAFQFARVIEERLIRKFDLIGCMSASNIEFLRSHYLLRTQQRVLLTPIWADITPPEESSRSEIRRKYDLPLDTQIIVFGGQITEGRGIEEILHVAELIKEAYQKITFLFIGDGRLVPLIKARVAGGLENVVHRSRVPREDYLRVLNACDFGLVATVANVESFSFPSKTIDYLRAGLPIIASVEAGNDYREFLEEWGIGVSAPAENPRALFNVIARLAANSAAAEIRPARARACLEAVFDVRKAVDRLHAAIAEIPARGEPAGSRVTAI